MNKNELLNSILGLMEELGFTIEHNEQLLSDTWRRSTVNFSFYREIDGRKEPFAFVVMTSDTENVNTSYAKRIVSHVIEESAFWFGIVISREIHLYSTVNTDTPNFSWKTVDLERINVVSILFDSMRPTPHELLDDLIVVLNDQKGLTESEKTICSTLFSEAAELIFLPYGRTVSIPMDQQFKFVSSVLEAMGVKGVKEVCRYTSASSLHRIIKDNRESMCGLAVMNDKTEGLFFDKCLTPAVSINLWRRPQREIDDYNNVFITSLCRIEKADDLTMWRLYGGQDGDGVCMVYEVDDTNIFMRRNFFLLPVFYGGKNNPILAIFKFLQKLPPICGFRFVLSYRNIFRYFVKPDNFSIEDEQRLLFKRDDTIRTKIDNPKWIFNPSYKIFHPIQELELKSSGKEVYSPLVLRKIILGPKCAESNINRVQLISWLKSIGRPGVSVEESSIKFYR